MKIIFWLFILLNTYGFSQNIFFLRPNVNFKTNFSSADPFLFSDYAFNPSPYFYYNNKQVCLPTGLNLGLSAGYIMPNKRLIFEVGVQGDESQSGMTLHFVNTNVGTYYYNNSAKSISGLNFIRYSLQCAVKLKEFKKKSSSYFVLGFDYAHAKNRGGQIITSSLSGASQVDDNVYLSYSNNLTQDNASNVLIHAGINSTIYLSNKYLFDLGIFYMYGFRSMSSMNTDVNILNNSGLVKSISYTSISNGGGLTLQLSRSLKFGVRNRQ
jgi:hypothetical protein